MKNTFYNDFDYECVETPRQADYRTPFERDRDRIIHTSAFRRLQAKTQVFLSGEYDFYRTRLTHSLEVAQIGRAVCNYVHRTSTLLSDSFFIDADLVEAICLSHDLGHPPFGHAGERTLNTLMNAYGGFEGNAQSLRLVTEIIYSEQGHRKGMNPTRAFMDGILKYKTLRRQSPHPDHHFLYDDQEHFLQFTFGGKPVPEELTAGKPLNKFRCVECQIMDWADDAAYSLNDVADGIRSGFITVATLECWAADHSLTKEETQYVNELCSAISSGNVEHVLGKKIGGFIRACTITERKNFMSETTNRYLFSLKIDPAIQKESELYKRIALNIVFQSPQLQQLEHKGDFILQKIFSTLEENYLNGSTPEMHLLPRSTEQHIAETTNAHQRARLLCDQVAGMTDGFAVRTYKRLFEPEFGSLADLI
ncbi:MAG: dNTP triphosphohydrolase [Bacteroidota bacterium]|nr:dNTP triphosphohydrolase [Bacteroidota bacterium]